MSEDDDSERSFEPTQHKLDEARRRGDIVRSTEVTLAASYAGLALTATALGGWSLHRFGTVASSLLEQGQSLSSPLLSGGATLLGGLIGQTLAALAPWFVLPAAVVLLALIVQRALVFAPDKLMPKLDRIDPFANAKQKFGRTGMFEFAKSFVKLIAIAVILGRFMLNQFDAILFTQELEPPQIAAALGQLILHFLFLLAVLAVVIGAIDYFWQRAEFLRRNRMTRKELVDDMKQSEGDPHVKQQRRQKAIALATRQMIADVAKADVVIVNPTHYAVALKWEKGEGRAPHCLAKGVDEVAARIREVANEAAVPIHSDPPTARALYATIEVGAEIRPEHYRAVAAAIRFAEKMRRRARGMK